MASLLDPATEGNIVRPEVVIGGGLLKLFEAAGQVQDGERGIGIGWMGENAEKGVFGDRTGAPALGAGGGEPRVGRAVMHMRRVEEGNQDIDIKQEWAGHVRVHRGGG